MAIYGWFGCCVSVSISSVNPQAAEVVDETLQHFSVYTQTNGTFTGTQAQPEHNALCIKMLL